VSGLSACGQTDSNIRKDHTVDGGRYRIKHHLTVDEIKLYDNKEWRWRIVKYITPSAVPD